MVLSWNLMCRSDSTGNIMLPHISWADDALLVKFARQKNDQTGEALSNDKHIYANVDNPTVCPILHLALLIFSFYRGDRLKDHVLFPGDDGSAKNRFSSLSLSAFQRVFR
jgi:hypothetical protein